MALFTFEALEKNCRWPKACNQLITETCKRNIKVDKSEIRTKICVCKNSQEATADDGRKDR